MNTEEIVIGLISDYKYAGLKEEDIEQRKAFLAVLAFILVSKTHKNYLDEALLQGLDHLCGIDNGIAMLKQSHQALLDEIKGYYSQEKSLTERALDSLLPIVKNTCLNDIPAISALEIYDRTLQRLQKMNVENNLSRSFKYDYLPVELAELAIQLTEEKSNINLAEVFSSDGRFACMFSALSDISHASVIAEKQSPTYIKHMFAIAGVTSLDISASSEDFKNDFDVSILLQSNDSETIKAVDLEMAMSAQLKSLKDKGVAIAFVGQGFLIGKLHQKFRRQLITARNIKSIIELPTKLFSPTYPSLFAMILQKDHKADTVEFVNLSASFEPYGKINRFVADMPSQDKNSAHFVVHIETIINSNYSLIPKSYASVEKCKRVNHEQLRQRLCELQLNNDKNLKSLLQSF